MFRTVSKVLLLLACLSPALPVPGMAQDTTNMADTLPARVLFITSGGYWEESVADSPAAVNDGSGSDAAPEAGAPAGAQKRGYYRLIAIRGEDNTSQLQLQQIELTPDGPKLRTSTAVEAINTLGGYVTDIRPEDSTGSASQSGFAAYIYLRTDLSVAEPETWALYIDEFGEIQVDRSSN